MKIGVLALQGAFAEHVAALRAIGVEAVEVRLPEQLERLLEVDDVDAAALREDEAAHLGIPAARLVAEVHSGFQQVFHRDPGQAPSTSRMGHNVG